MKILFVFLALLGFSFEVNAQALNIRPLFENTSYLPHILIPFQVTGSVISSGGRVYKIELKHASGSSAGADCRGMADPYHKAIFLIKCDRPATVNIHIEIAVGSSIHPLIYNGVEIVSPGTGLVIVDPDGDDPSGPSPDWTAGRNLYNSYCLTCHLTGKQSTKKNKTATQIRNAILNPGLSAGQMQSDELEALTTKQLQQIQTYLANP